MIQPLPDFPPLFPPGRWWRIFIGRRLDGASQEDAVAEANRGSGLNSRNWMRLPLAGGQTFSFSVKGGASSLKNRHPASWRMAQEVEREIPRYVSTLATIYGRTPFHHLLGPELVPECSPGEKAAEVCMECFRKVHGVILPDSEMLLPRFSEAVRADSGRLAAVSAELSESFSPDLSIVDTLVRLGPDAIFPLLGAF